MTRPDDVPMFREIDCPLCDTSDYEVVYPSTLQTEPGPDSVKITDGEYQVCGQIVRCKGCSLVFVNPQLEASKLISLYSSMQDPAYHIEASGRQVAFRRILKRLKALRDGNSSAIRLLDVGAATGLLMQKAEEMGWQAFGVEPSQWAAKVARESHGLNVHCGTLDDCPYERNSFDFVTVVDVLEHVSDPLALLELTRSFLKPGGAACVVTPDFNSLMSRLLRQRWWHVRQAHQYYFSDETLRKLLSSAGYDVVKEKRYGWTFSVDYWASRFENFNKPVFFVLQFFKNRTFVGRIFSWNVGFNFRDSFEWYLKIKRSSSNGKDAR